MRAKRQAIRKTAKQSVQDEQTATLLTHVRELQLRMLVTAVVLIGSGVVAYLYYAKILDVLRAPLNAPLYYNSVSGSFAFVMKICLVAGIAVSVPLIVYNFIMFVRPAFIEVFTKKRVFMMTVGSIAAAAAGAIFGFTFIIPGALHFFSGFQVHGLNQLISADSYLNFVINVLITFVLMFQLPIIISLIDRIKPISPRAMIKGEKWALVGSLVISVLVPFAMDFMTQILIAAPIFILYNLSFVVVAWQHHYGRRDVRKINKLRSKAEKKARRVMATPLPTAPKRKGAPAPVVAVKPLAPHPQLAEVFAFQTALEAHQQTGQSLSDHAKLKAQTVKHPTHTVSHAPIQTLAAKPVSHTPTQTLRRTPISMDGMSRPGSQRMQPANVIRQAGVVLPPERQVVNPRMRPSMNMMADIR